MSKEIKKSDIIENIDNDLDWETWDNDPNNWSDSQWLVIANEKGMLEQYDNNLNHVYTTKIVNLKQLVLKAYNDGNDTWHSLVNKNFKNLVSNKVETKKNIRNVISQNIPQPHNIEHLYTNILHPALNQAGVEIGSYGDVFKEAAKLFDSKVINMSLHKEGE